MTSSPDQEPASPVSPEQAITPGMALAKALVWILGLGLAGFHLYTAGHGVLSPLHQRSVHLMGLLLICFLIFGTRQGRKATAPDWISWILFMASAGLAVYLVWALEPRAVLERGIMGTTQVEAWLGVGLVLLVLEATRRSVGMPIVLVAGAFLLYGLAGPYLPEFIAHKGYEVERLVSYLVWTTEGLFGIPIAVSATFVIIFILFGAFLDKLGAGGFFIDLALALTGRMRGGPALTAVVASGLMGSISGSSVSNVVTTGAFTIPLMRRTGYKPLFAGAVEAVASTGGQIMPPVMGAGAFVMAEMLGVSYAKIALAAAIPALLYFLSVGLMVYFEAGRLNLKTIERGQVPPIKETLRKGCHLLIPLGLLIYLLVVKQLSPMLAGLYSIVALVGVASLFSLIRERRVPWLEILEALKHGVVTAVPVAMACAAAGLVIGVVSLTGLGVRFTQFIVGFSGGVLWLAGLLTMVACIILGMGLPTTAAYIITAILGVPALEKLGVDPMAAHMFIFYFAIISFITPPVAISAYAASAISGANAMKTGLMSFQLGLAGFIVPFVFIYSPSILLQGSWVQVLPNTISAVMGVAALAGAQRGWFLVDLAWWQRLFLLGAAGALIAPSIWISGAGVLLLVATLISHPALKRRGIGGKL
jgi:TRAP transporter 4TM/12TM fusion protein